MEENTTTVQSSWVQDAMKKGLILGLIHILIFLVIYYLFTSKMTGFSYLFLIMVLNMGYIIYYGIQYRTELGGYVDFGPAFKYIFVLLLTNGVIGAVFGILFQFVEPAYPDVMAQSQLDTQLYWAQRFGAPENAIDEMREKFDFEEIKNRYSFKGLLFGLGFVVLFDVLGALIAALFVRKRMPEKF
jgi:hypothetical protein